MSFVLGIGCGVRCSELQVSTKKNRAEKIRSIPSSFSRHQPLFCVVGENKTPNNGKKRTPFILH